MTKAKYQVFLDEKSQELLDRLCKRFGWSCGQAIERLLRYYATTQAASRFFDIDDLDEQWGCAPWPDEETGELVYGSGVIESDDENLHAPEIVATSANLVRLVEIVKEGLTPMDGFNLDEE